ncbi:hypothetical protein B0H13DRAFT_1872908 [Mycena leptocephala]|nr:hypothetical protein B0H13DRAFT_1872908 [Mycena leptocephala]
MLKMGVKKMSPGERTSFQAAWIERLISAAVNSGARIPSKKRKSPPDDTSPGGIVPPPTKRLCTPIARGDSDGALANTSIASASSSATALARKMAVPSSPIVIDDDSDDEPASTFLATAVASSSATASATSSAIVATPPSPSSREVVVGNPRQSTLASFGWKKATPEDIAIYWAKAKEAGADRREAVLQIQEKKKQNKKQHERDLARLRQQRRREKKRAEKEVDADEKDREKLNANTVLLRGADALASGSKVIEGIADLSRPSTQAWKKNRNGTLGGIVHGPSKRVFWFTPFLFAIIEPTIRWCGWSAPRTVEELQLAHPRKVVYLCWNVG